MPDGKTVSGKFGLGGCWLDSLLLGGLLLGCLPAVAYAQQTARLSPLEISLPDAPGFVAQLAQPPQPQVQSPSPQGTGNMGGIVLDINEGVVPNAAVTLIQEGNPVERTTIAGTTGSFLFIGLPAGKFRLTITAPGLETFVSSPITLHAGEHKVLARIALPLAPANISVQVTVTQAEVALAQLHLEEKQRLLGILPNFYSSYIWDAAPLSKKQKFGLAAHSIFDPVSFVFIGVTAGVQQANDTFADYGQGTKGYAKRYFADYGDDVINRMISGVLLPVVFRQDPRYFYKGTGSKRSRAIYAMSRAIISRGDNGHAMPNYSQMIGGFVTGSIANTYRPGADRGIGLVLTNGFLAIGNHAFDNLLREFVFRHVTYKVPDYSQKGEPPSSHAQAPAESSAKPLQSQN
jgi:hypothetical protein